MSTPTARPSKTKDMVYISLFTALITIYSWISIPATVPFTLQTMAVFTAVGLLGGRRGTVSVLLYILLGAFGLPVFSGFRGGAGVLLGTTGGYIIGFLFTALWMWAIEKIFGKSRIVLAVSMVTGLLVCYTFGTVWFMLVYLHSTGAVSLMTVLGWCVIPFLIPDAVKIALSYLLSNGLKRFVE